MSTSWHIIGVGAIGGLFARRLQHAGHPVTLLSRDDVAAQRELRFADAANNCVDSEWFKSETIAASTPIKQLLVCTKSFAADTAVRSVAHRLTPDSVVLLLINGMGIAERLHGEFPNQAIAVGTTTAACFRDGNGCWHPVAEGETTVGWFEAGRGRSDQWQLDWRALRGVTVSNTMPIALLQKVAINAVINPATALMDVPNGDLLLPQWQSMIKRACDEVAKLLYASDAAFIADTLEARVDQVLSTTAGNTSSMRADLLAGRPTEVEAILGYLLEQRSFEDSQKPSTPLLDDWLDRLRQIDSKHTTDAKI